MKKLCILVRTIGPYHHARFKILANHFNLFVIETRPEIGEYDWESISSIDINYNVVKNTHAKRKTVIEFIKLNLLKINPDIIITHGWADYEYLFTLLHAKKLKIPLITFSDSTLDDFKRNAFKEYVKRFIAQSFDGFLAAGARSIKYLNSLGISKNIYTPCDVVDNEYFALNVGNFRSNELSRTILGLPEKYILCVSRFIEKKNIIRLIEAYKDTLSNSPSLNYNLVIVGSGPLKTEINIKITQLCLQDKILLYDFAQYEVLPEFYAFASALIIPSRSDQWGLVVNEAMASGLPVLVSERCGCVDNLVINGQNGYSFEPDIHGIKNVLLEFNKLDKTQLCFFGEKSKAIIANYSITNFVDAILKLTKLESKPLQFLHRIVISILTR